MSRYLSENKEQEVLKLYFNGSDKRIRVISEIVGCKPPTVSTLVGKKFNNEIDFKDDGYFIFHSGMNC